jgi:hypothetical protein
LKALSGLVDFQKKRNFKTCARAGVNQRIVSWLQR